MCTFLFATILLFFINCYAILYMVDNQWTLYEYLFAYTIFKCAQFPCATLTTSCLLSQIRFFILLNSS